MAERLMVEALDAFSVTLSDGTPFVVRHGDRFWSDDPIVKGRNTLFGEVTVRSTRPVAPPSTAAVETATAAPGARRAMSKPAAKKPDAEEDKADA